MQPDQMAVVANRLAAGEVLRAGDLEVLDEGPFTVAALGLVWDEISLSTVAAHVDIDSRHHQPHGIVHGGVWCGIVESVASVAGFVRVAADQHRVVGVHNSTDFLRPHQTGRVEAAAHPIHVGRTQHLWEVRLARATDAKLVARGQVRLQVLSA